MTIWWCTVAAPAVSHLTSQLLKQVDAEFRSVAASLLKTFWRVAVPVYLPAILDISVYIIECDSRSRYSAKQTCRSARSATR